MSDDAAVRKLIDDAMAEAAYNVAYHNGYQAGLAAARRIFEDATVRPAINEAEPSPEQQTQWPVERDIMDALMKSDGMTYGEIYRQISSDTGRWYDQDTMDSTLRSMQERGLLTSSETYLPQGGQLTSGKVSYRQDWQLTDIGREKAS